MKRKQDFTWEMDIDILSSEVKTKKYTYFGTYFTHENYHRRLSGRKLPMEKPNNGWVLQGWYQNKPKEILKYFSGCITCRGCSRCLVYSGVSMFPDQLTTDELVDEAQRTRFYVESTTTK